MSLSPTHQRNHNLILGLGSNLGQKIQNISQALKELSQHFTLYEVSPYYSSAPYDVKEQPDFCNAVAHFKCASECDPLKLLHLLKSIETTMGRVNGAPKGPRLIDIDILFIDELIYQHPRIQIPHPSWKTRSFVVRPLMTLAIWKEIRRTFPVPADITFPIEAHIIKP
jgi:2-amino-4-hydroxy-6-hydroxymethyldihydropteridine diphosphokinase